MSRKAVIRKRIWIVLLLLILSLVTLVILAFKLLGNALESSINEMHESVSEAVRSANDIIDEDAGLIKAYEDVDQCKRDVIALLKKRGGVNERELMERYQLNEEDDNDFNSLLSGQAAKEHISSSVTAGSTGFLMFIDSNDGTVIGYPDKEFNGLICSVISSVDMQLSRGGSVRTDIMIITDESRSQIKLVAGFRIGSGIMVIGDSSDINTYVATDIGTMVLQVMIMAGNLWLIFLAVIIIAAQYSKYSLKEKNKEYGQFRQWLISMVPIGCILVFIMSCYLYSLLAITNRLNYESLHAKRIRTTIENNKEQNAAIEDWFSRENLIKCRMAADLVKSLDRVPDREDMKEISDIIGVQYTYRYDSIGKVSATDAPYDNIVLSNDPESQSYVFRALLKGVDHVVQEIVEDNLSGESVQYAGVSIRDDNDKADGFVQICVSTDDLNRLTENYSIEEEIERINGASKELAFLVDKESNRIIYSSYKKISDKNLEDTSINKLTLKDGVNGIIQIEYLMFLSDVSELDEGFLVLATPKDFAVDGRYSIALFMTVMTLLSFIMIIFVSLFRYKKLQEEGRQQTDSGEKAAGKSKKAKKNAASREAESMQQQENAENEWGLFISVTNLLKEKSGKNMEAFEERWKENRKADDELTSEERIGGTINTLLFLLSSYVVIVLFVDGIIGVGGREEYDYSLDTINYLLYGNWDKGFNIFAVTMCLLIICISISFIGIFNRLLYSVAKISNTRIETVCMLLRSSTKYIAGILIVYLCVGQFVEDATTLFATTGVISVVIGLGAKDLIGDILAGFFLVFENAFQVGDYISVDGWSGVVTSVGIRMTTLTSYGDDRYINNSDLKKIINMNRGTVRAATKVAIAYKEDLEKVEALLKKELPLWKDRIPGALKAPYYYGVDRFEFNAVFLCVAVSCESSSRWGAERALNREIKLLFDKNGIKTAYEIMTDENGNPVYPLYQKSKGT